MSETRRFLLTGATGVVGLSIIEQLRPSDQVTILVNQRQFTTLPAGITKQIKGNICSAQMGLTQQQCDELKQIDTIVHCAALTDFHASPDVLDNTNINGLKHTLALATQLNAKLIYISTAFVHQRDGHDLNPYESSKKRAEALLPSSVTIVRPSIIVGDSREGVMPKKQGIHNLMKLAVKEALPVVPGNGHTLVDVIPRDIVASAILAIVDQRLEGDYWLTAGRYAPQLGDVLGIGSNPKLTERYPIRFTPPKLMSPEMFERLVKPVFLPALPRRYQRLFQETTVYLKYLNMTETFHSDLEQLPSPSLSTQDLIDILAKNIAAYEQTHYLQDSLASTEQGASHA